MKKRSRTAAAQRAAMRRSWLWAVCAVVCGVVLFAVFSRYGLLTRLRVEREYSELQHRYDSLARRARELQQRVWLLQHDERELERLARERYGMARPGETVYVVPRRP
jgi:cell division protein FtsB